ncbi:MAG: c-type cytochrome [Gammaproteobacteria bacterium]
MSSHRISRCIFLIHFFVLSFATVAQAVGPPVGSEALPNVDYGLSTAKRANCMGCHKWHGNGGPGYGGAAISLRKSQLNREQLVQVIKCGRPGTNMPYFDRKAYKHDECYGLTFADFADDENNRPLQGKKYLNQRQIDAVVDFVIAELQGKPATKAYCEKFFGGPTKECELTQ